MKKALLVGINAYPTAPLHGCVNDIQDMSQFLVASCNFLMDDIRLLTDERATKQNIIERLSWLLAGVREGDTIFFHYSGHGAQMATRNPMGEIDNLDEIICPVDFDWTDETAIRDKEFSKLFLSIPQGVSFTWVSDSCNSGDLFKLIPMKNQFIKTMPVPVDMQWKIATAKQKGLEPLSLAKAVSLFNGVYVSGCRSDQTSKDAFINSRFNGALTYYLLETLSEPTGLSSSMRVIINGVKKKLHDNDYSQEPQLEGSQEKFDLGFLKSN